MVHPSYKAASEYWDFSDVDSLTIHGSGHSTAEGRGGSGLYPMFGGVDNWIDMGDFAGECLSAPIRCTTGKMATK